MTGHYAAPLTVLALLFAVSALAVGRGQGVRCLALLVWVPLLLFATGWLVTVARWPLLPIVLAAGLIALACQTFLLLGAGASARRAFLGACAGYLMAVVVGLACLHAFRITGIYSPVMRDLWYAPGTGALPFHWLALGGITLAGAGLIADLAVAVTATIEEVHGVNPRLPAADLFSAGMRFGRDVIGTEVNTLPLAILGTSIGGILLLLVRPDVARWPYSWMILANRETTAVELVALAAGTIALVLTIPLTAFFVAHILGATASTPPTPAPAPARRSAAILPLAALLLLAAGAWAGCAALGRTRYVYPGAQTDGRTLLVRGTVLSAHPPASPWAPRVTGAGSESMQTLRVRRADGRTLSVENPLTGSPVNDRIPLTGDRVVVRLQQAGSSEYAALGEIERDRGLLLVLVAICAVVVLVAGRQGWRALASLAASGLVIALLLAAIVRWHAPPLPATLLCTLAATGLLFVILCGWRPKAFCAAAGTMAGLAAAGLAARLFGRWLALSGRHDSDLLTLGLYSSGRGLDFRAILESAALIGALGVTTDVAMAVASAVSEVRRADPTLGFRGLLAGGFYVGRKVLAAMFGAILFAYVGLNIGVFLLPWAGTGSIGQALGNEKVIAEVFRLLVGGLAIVWTVPATSLISAWVLGGRGHRNGVRNEAEEARGPRNAPTCAVVSLEGRALRGRAIAAVPVKGSARAWLHAALRRRRPRVTRPSMEPPGLSPSPSSSPSYSSSINTTSGFEHEGEGRGRECVTNPGRRALSREGRALRGLALLCLALLAPRAGRAAEADLHAGMDNLRLAEKDGKLSGSFRYQLVVGHFYEWNTDPTAIPGVLGEVAARTGLKSDVEFKAVGLDDPQMFRNPLLIMTGNRVFRLSPDETDNLRRYLLHGGFLYADDCGGADFSFRRMIKELFPDATLEPVTPDDPLLHEFYRLDNVPKVVDLYGGPALAYSVVQNGRRVVLYTYDTDLPCAWERYPDGSYVHVLPADKREAAFKFGVNMVLHALRPLLGAAGATVSAASGPALPASTPLPPNAVRNFPMHRQLPCNHIAAVAGNDRYDWFGGFTYMPGEDEGLARYEKATGQWRVFMDAEGILSEEVNCLAMDGDKVLVGSDTWKWTKGMATFDPATGQWTTLTSQDGLPHDRVISIVPDGDRTWIACRVGMAVLPKGAQRAQVVDAPVFPEGGAFMIGLMVDPQYVWANHFGGLARLEKENNRWIAVSNATPLIPAHVLAMAHAGASAWFLAPVEDTIRLVRFDYASGQFEDWRPAVDVHWTNAVSLAATANELFVGMDNNEGIYTFDIARRAVTRHWVPDRLPADTTYSAYRMWRDGDTIWASVIPYGGLWRRNPESGNWTLIPYRTGTPSSHVLSLLKTAGRLYVGTLSAGPWYYELASSWWQNLNLQIRRRGIAYMYLGDHDAIKWDNIYALAQFGGRIWMGTNHGLIAHDPTETPTGFEVIGPQGRICTGLAILDGLVWASGTEGDVTAYDPAAHSWQSNATWRVGAPVRAVACWNGALCAATEKGLFRRGANGAPAARLDGTNAALDVQGCWVTATGLWFSAQSGLQVLPAPGAAPHLVPGSGGWGAIHCVAEVDGTILVGTESGLMVCDGAGRLRARYDHTSGLGADAIAAIAVDPTAVWLGTLGGGICRVAREALLASPPTRTP